MGSRLDLHSLLLSLGGPNVYYQIPPNLTIKYPCIKYELNKMENEHANDSVYYQKKAYLITVMSKIVDDPIIDKISILPKCSHDRSFIGDNIYHTVFKMYY